MAKKPKKPVKKAAPAKKAPAPVKKKAAPAKAAKTAKAASVKAAPKKSAAELKLEKRKAAAAAAMKVAMDAQNAKTKNAESSEEEDEFDPEAFFAASGGQGIFRAHVMRKERVDLDVTVRFRKLDSPLVQQGILINLSKGGLCIKTPDVIKAKTVLRIEIPLPHTSELFAIQAEVIWSTATAETASSKKDKIIHTGLKFLPMNLAKQSVINTFIQQRRDQIVMAKIGLSKFNDSAPVAGLD